MEFFERYKNIFLAIGFVAVIVIMGYLLYSTFFKPSTLPSGSNVNLVGTSTGNGLPSAQTGRGQIIPDATTDGLTGQNNHTGGQYSNAGIKPSETANGGLTETQEVSALPTVGATAGGDGKNLQYYSPADGRFYRLDDNGNAVVLSDKVFHQVKNVTWAPNKREAILEYPDGAKTIYNFQNNKQITLPSHWKDFSYSPNGNEIIMKSMGDDPDNRWLAIVSNDGTQVHGLEALGEKDETVYAKWSPNNQIAAMYTEGVSFDRQEVYFVGLNKENFKSTVVEGRGFVPQWSPSGQELVYSVYSSQSDMKPELWIVDANGDNIGNNRRKLNLQTWADKCSFGNMTTMYCAVPTSLEEGSGLFPDLAKVTTDKLYEVNLKTGNKRLLATPDGDFTISNINLTDDQKNLYFNDRNTGKLYKIKLK